MYFLCEKNGVFCQKNETINPQSTPVSFYYIHYRLLSFILNNMTTRRCSCCSQPGHNITRCNDAYATTLLNEIKSSHLELAMRLVDEIPNNIVKFVLVQGFSASVSLNREALRCLVQRHYTNPIHPSPLLIANRAQQESRRLQQQQQRIADRAQARADAQEAEEERLHEEHRRQRSNNQSRRNNEDGYARYALLVEQFRSSPYNSITERRAMYKSLARCYLAILERMSNALFGHRNPTQEEFNSYIMNKLTDHGLECPRGCSCYIPMFSRIRDVVWQNFAIEEIIHISNIARMYNYQRLLNNQSTFEFVFSEDAVVAKTNEMKPLKIKVILCSPCETGDTCGVCFEDLEPKQIVKTGCGHVYCSTCIAGVAHQRGEKSFITCPGCRAEITELKVPNKDEEKLVADGLKPVPI